LALCKRWLTGTSDDDIKIMNEQWLPEFQTGVLAFLNRFDIILSPTFSSPAVQHGTTWDNDGGFDFVQAVSLVPKVPAGVVRCGTLRGSLPIGVQVVAKPFREDVALAVMHVLEKTFGGWRPPEM